jgi:hypothetical protein
VSAYLRAEIQFFRPSSFELLVTKMMEQSGERAIEPIYSSTSSFSEGLQSWWTGYATGSSSDVLQSLLP